VLVAGEADGSDPSGVLMNQNNEEQKMQYGGRNGIPRAARGRFDGFGYSVYALPPDAGGLECFVEAG
jgi:hypothetical protein